MGGSVLIVGPYRQVHDLFNPLWSELEMEQQRFTSTEAAVEVIHGGDPPSAVLVSYPLWDSSLDDLLTVLGRTLQGDQPVPVVVVAAESSISEVAALEDRGVIVLSESAPPEDLHRRIRHLFGQSQRGHPRFIVRMAVQVGDGAVLRACQSENISLSGMLIRTSETFPVGSQVDLEFSVGDDDEPLRCRAEVVRYTDPDLETARGMGVHFVSFEEDGQERWEAFLNE